VSAAAHDFAAAEAPPPAPVLAAAEPERSGLTGGTFDVFGTNAGAETVSLLDHVTVRLQGDFARGGDTLVLAGRAADFTARIEGSSVVLASAHDDITAYVPVGLTGLELVFEGDGGAGEGRVLKLDGAQVVLGSQALGADTAALQVHDGAAVLAALPAASLGALTVLEHHAFA
jgi:hypothetical protein